MDYRHTEDFARRMELAELQAHALRRQAIADFWSAVGAAVQRAAAAALRRSGRSRRAPMVTEA